jgi:hypothetical protein
MPAIDDSIPCSAKTMEESEYCSCKTRPAYIQTNWHRSAQAENLEAEKRSRHRPPVKPSIRSEVPCPLQEPEAWARSIPR